MSRKCKYCGHDNRGTHMYTNSYGNFCNWYCYRAWWQGVSRKWQEIIQ